MARHVDISRGVEDNPHVRGAVFLITYAIPLAWSFSARSGRTRHPGSNTFVSDALGFVLEGADGDRGADAEPGEMVSLFTLILGHDPSFVGGVYVWWDVQQLSARVADKTIWPATRSIYWMSKRCPAWVNSWWTALALVLVLAGCGRGTGTATNPSPALPSPSISDTASPSPSEPSPSPSATATPTATPTAPNPSTCDPDSATLAKRVAPSVAYDPATNQLLMFGGTLNSQTGYCDTWLWTGNAWKHLHPAHHPSGRSFAYIAFDGQANRLLLYGGGAFLRDPWKYDAWSWDGTDWQLVAGERDPKLQTGFAMTSAPNVGVFLVYASGTLDNHGQELFATYRWTAAGWSQITVGGPITRGWPGFAYDPALVKILMFGGGTEVANAADTWTWDGHTWTRLTPTGAQPAGGIGAMAYDSGHGLMVWFGSDGTWTFDGTQWRQRLPAAQSPPYGSWGTLTYDPAHQQVLLTGLMSGTTGEGTGHTYVWDGTSWTTY